MKRLTMTLGALAALAAASAQEQYFEKVVIFPEGATPEQKVEMASRLVPSAKQMAWQDMELTAFLHFGVNTFTDREWGDGKEEPSVFNPTDLDTDQWVKALSDAGFAMAMLTAKHHDGFCLWPSETTGHTVAASPWEGGKGDVVARLAESCRKYGMKLGLYLSPWDRNAECYGDSPRYNDMFVAQLTELLTRYGTVDEVWFDGACGEGPNGKRQEYDWQRYKEVIESLQPGAVVAIMGDDVRWVGNEKGLGRETEWSATPFVPGILPQAAEVNKALGLFPKAPDLGSRELLVKADKLYWWPSEVDVSIRPGWFYHEKEQPRSLAELANIYVNSVGRNSVLLLNIPPDRRGRIADADVKRLQELRQWIDSSFADNRKGKPGSRINTVVIAEDISKGQRVEAFRVEALTDGAWRQVAEGTTIGKKRILMFDPVVADDVRVVVTSERATPNLEVLGTYFVTMPAPEAEKLPEGYAYGTAKSVKLKGRSLVMDLGKEQMVSGIEYVPGTEGIIFKYRLYALVDGKWQQLPATGEFSNIAHNPIPQRLYFDPVKTRRIKLECIATADGGTKPASAPVIPLLPAK